MHNGNEPRALTREEWDEIASLDFVREAWGLSGDNPGGDLGSASYGARFDYMTGGPGYIGDLYFIQDDALGAPLVLIRLDGKLVTGPYHCAHWPRECECLANSA